MLRHIGITAIGFGAQMGLSLFTGIVAARLLGPDMRGELAALLLLPMALQLFTLAGLAQAQLVLTAKNPQKAGAITGTCFGLMAMTSVIGVAIGLLALPFLLRESSAELRTHAAWLLIAILPLLTLYGIPSNTALGLKHYVTYHMYRLVVTVIYLLAVVTAFFWPSALSIGWFYALLLLFVGMPFSYLYYKKTIGQKLTWDKTLIAPLFDFAKPNFLSQLPQIVGQRLDQFVVLALLSTTSLGYYSIALAIGQMFQTVLQSVGTLLLPYLAGDGYDAPSRTLLFGKMLRVSIAFSATGGALLCLLLPWLLPFMFGEEFAPSVPSAMMLVVASFFGGVHFVFMDGFRGFDMPKLPVKAEVVLFVSKLTVLGVGLVFWRAPTLPYIAFLTLISFLPALVYDFWLYHRHIEPLDRRWILRLGSDTLATSLKIQRALASR